MLALGIDPGTAICGYGVVRLDGSALKPVTFGAVLTSPEHSVPDRLLEVHRGIERIIQQYKPDMMGIEQLFFNKNVRTAMAVGQARGVVLLAAAAAGLPVLEPTPLQVKQSVVGYGKATKEQVTYMVQRLLALRESPRPDDVADALAVAVCTLHTYNLRNWQESGR